MINKFLKQPAVGPRWLRSSVVITQLSIAAVVHFLFLEVFKGVVL